MSDVRDLVYLHVEAERLRQDKLWGEQNHDDPAWNAILGEEVGEVARAVLGLRFGCCDDTPGELLNGLREELVQVAAVSIAWVEAISRRAA